MAVKMEIIKRAAAQRGRFYRDRHRKIPNRLRLGIFVPGEIFFQELKISPAYGLDRYVNFLKCSG